MSDWIAHEVAPTVRVIADRSMPDLAPWLEAEIERLWQRERALKPGLFNGRIFSADRFTGDAILGHWTEFRRSLAQMRRGELYDQLGVRSLAVSGVLCCADGIVIGRRSREAVYQAGRWQLPPAGSVDAGAERPDGVVDVAWQVLDELQEEIGLGPDSVARVVPLCVVEHPGSHVSDLGLAMHIRASGDEILSIHAAHGNREYEELHVMPAAQVLSLGADMMPTVPAFLARLPDFSGARV